MKDKLLTPQAQLERAKRLMADAAVDMVSAIIAMSTAQNEWVDQKHSPLGKARHLRLARAGTLPSRKVGHLVLVRREDLNAYLEREGFRPAKATPEDEVVAMVEKLVGTRR